MPKSKISDVKPSDYEEQEAEVSPSPEHMVMDTVCGCGLDPSTAKYKTVYKGGTYFFCEPGCKKAFDKDPDKYIKRHRDLAFVGPGV